MDYTSFAATAAEGDDGAGAKCGERGLGQRFYSLRHSGDNERADGCVPCSPKPCGSGWGCRSARRPGAAGPERQGWRIVSEGGQS